MNASIKSMFAFVAIGLVGACTSQAAVQAKFHLPITAHWGKAVLAPGDYNIRISDLTSGRNQVLIEGEGNIIYEMPVAVDPLSTDSASSLQLVQTDGNYFVREYRSGFAGKTFTFGTPKQMASRHTKTVQMAN